MNKGFDIQKNVEPGMQPGVGETHRLGPLRFCIVKVESLRLLK
jgi:hypothetical protein